MLAGLKARRAARVARAAAELAWIRRLMAENDARIAELNQPCRLCAQS